MTADRPRRHQSLSSPIPASLARAYLSGMSRPLARLAASVLLLLHGIVAGLLPIADARAEATETVISTAAHVEAPDSGSCPQVHDDACQLCSLVRLAGQASMRVAPPPIARAVPAPAVAREAHAVIGESPAPDQARAPPVA